MTRSPLAVKLVDDSFLDENSKIKDNLKFSINNPVFRIQNSKFLVSPDDKFETMLFLPEGENRKGEGGLRTKGYFKFSYKKMDDKWFICDFYGNILKKAPENLQQKIEDYISSLDENQSINDLPLITVVTVVFNGAKTLEQTIQSVINQTHPNVEYIIINGGSTDETMEIITTHEYEIDYWVSEKDNGIFEAMNKGIDLAFGEYIYFLNAGDEFVGCDILNDLIEIIRLDDKRHIIYSGDVVLYRLREYICIANLYPWIPHQGAFIKTNIMKEYKFDTNFRIFGDLDLWKRLFKDGRYEYYKISKVITKFELGGIGNNPRFTANRVREKWYYAKEHKDIWVF